MNIKKLLLIAFLALATWAFFYYGGASYFSLEALKASQAQLDAWYRAEPLTVIALFTLIYIVLTALSFPGASILTLGAGAIFGVVTGTLIVSFASTIGATLAFLAARYLLGDWVQRRFGERMKAINNGLERDGPFFLFSLRLVPIFPFWLVNLLMGLTKMPTRTYFWVSQIGMLPGTLVYVNAGTQLSRINSLSDIASPSLIGSFVALALLPWFGRVVMNALKRRRLYARWKRPRRYDRNLIIIGGGAAGLVSALVAVNVRASVTLIEADEMGGDCLNTGCVPSKALIQSGAVAAAIRHAGRYGLEAGAPRLDFPAVMQRVQAIIAKIAPHDSVERFTGLGVDVIKGYARLIDPWTVEAQSADGTVQRLTARSIIIATGAEPLVPGLPGISESGYLTSDTMWDAFAARGSLPERIVVLGGGPIGCELSQALARLGAKVTQVEREERLMLREDEDVSALAESALAESGVEVLTGHEALRFTAGDAEGDSGGDKRPQGALITRSPAGERTIPYDAVIIAVGRKARLSGFGLEELGIETERTITTDAYLATILPNIYAAGDVAGPYQFTHTASHQAWYAGVNALFGQVKRFKVDYRVIPWVTFVAPEVARVGLNEQEAKAQNIAYEIYTYPMSELDRAVTDGATKGFVKVLTPPGKDRILGATIVASRAGEMIAEYTLAMKQGLGLKKILGTVHAYPTMAEANKFAAGEWQKANAPERLQKLSGAYHRWRRG